MSNPPPRTSIVRDLARTAFAAGTGKDIAEHDVPRKRSRLFLASRQSATLIVVAGLLTMCVWIALARASSASMLEDEASAGPGRDSSVVSEEPGLEDEASSTTSGKGSTGKSGTSVAGSGGKAGASAAKGTGTNGGRSEAEDGDIIVYVSGEVHNPGVYTLPAHSRIAALVEAAGGLTDKADRNAINLAAPVADAEHVHVLAVGEVAPASSASAGAQGSGSQQEGGEKKININTASAQELENIPGVGPVMAESIIRWRSENGNFSSVEDLTQVSGIGEKTLEKMRDFVVA